MTEQTHLTVLDVWLILAMTNFLCARLGRPGYVK